MSGRDADSVHADGVIDAGILPVRIADLLTGITARSRRRGQQVDTLPGGVCGAQSTWSNTLPHTKIRVLTPNLPRLRTAVSRIIRVVRTPIGITPPARLRRPEGAAARALTRRSNTRRSTTTNLTIRPAAARRVRRRGLLVATIPARTPRPRRVRTRARTHRMTNTGPALRRAAAVRPAVTKRLECRRRRQIPLPRLIKERTILIRIDPTTILHTLTISTISTAQHRRRTRTVIAQRPALSERPLTHRLRLISTLLIRLRRLHAAPEQLVPRRTRRHGHIIRTPLGVPPGPGDARTTLHRHLDAVRPHRADLAPHGQHLTRTIKRISTRTSNLHPASRVAMQTARGTQGLIVIITLTIPILITRTLRTNLGRRGDDQLPRGLHLRVSSAWKDRTQTSTRTAIDIIRARRPSRHIHRLRIQLERAGQSPILRRKIISRRPDSVPIRPRVETTRLRSTGTHRQRVRD